MADPGLKILNRSAVLKVHSRECAAELMQIPFPAQICPLDDVLQLPEKMSLWLPADETKIVGLVG